ncbi:MAG: hypothetical protein GY906_08890 [bacterium]|nr:hypothetical protein [bacterium]
MPDDIPVFDRQSLGAAGSIARIGNGELGGKAQGLKKIQDEILPHLDPALIEGFEVRVPSFVVLPTEVFHEFMESNELFPVALSNKTDDRIAHAFQQADIPPQYVGDLRALISTIQNPLAVRSSSLLEDALDHPFAGVYATKMIPNNEPDIDSRFRRLIEAIRFVWASTYFENAKAYMRAIGHDHKDERMAVIIQEVVGQRFEDRYYPHISGVARSYNYYPTGSAAPEEGVVNLALGLGKTIVDGGKAWSYSAIAPKAPPPFNNTADLLRNSQTEFWAINMGPPPVPDPIKETECMIQADLRTAERDQTLDYLVSSYDSGSDRMYSGISGKGARALTFAPLLGSRLIPFTSAVDHLVSASVQAQGQDVELEFAVTLHPRDVMPITIGFLQVRPMRLAGGDVCVEQEEMTEPTVVLASDNVLGNGNLEDIRDIVFVRPDVFDRAETPRIAMEVDSVNRALTDANRHYVLIGFGRWGTSDPWLGIPVAWGQISGARAIVEASLPDIQPDPSQGSHFFHNVLSFQILYITVEHDGEWPIDWAWLEQQTTITETEHVLHVRTDEPLTIKVDGANRRGVIARHG